MYSHRLTGRNIRLLDLQRSEPIGRIKCHLVDANLDNLPQFEALSYVWGDKADTTSIECNKQKFRVTKNLAAALTRLQELNSSRLIWADAICINQEDLKERNEQVGLMREIYHHATRVVIWLGPDKNNEASKAISAMEHIYAACLQLPAEDMDEFYKAPVFQREPAGDFDPQTMDDWVTLGQFLSRPWFFRVWCVQETAHATDRVVFCGQFKIPWNELNVVVSWIDDCQIHDDDMPSAFKEIDIRGAMSMYRVSKYDTDTTQGSLLELLNRFRHCLATDPKDKVFAVLGLMERDPLVAVDYGKPICEVYTDVALAAIEESKDLSVLSFVAHDSDYDSAAGFPSWVPRWNQVPNVQRLRSSREKWSACGYRKIEDFRPAFRGTVGLRGVRFDRIEFTTHICGGLDDSGEISSTQDILLQLWDERGSAQPSSGHSYTAVSSRSTAIISSIAGAPWESLFSHTNYYHNRRAFRTKEEYYGLGPACIKVGDIVVVLFGGNVPYVLRPLLMNFTFFGEAYIHEIMHGEIFNKLEDGQRYEETFVIC